VASGRQAEEVIIRLLPHLTDDKRKQTNDALGRFREWQDTRPGTIRYRKPLALALFRERNFPQGDESGAPPDQ
jgi:hypothetical protein